jgi:phospholipase C
MMENRSFDHMLGGLRAVDPRIDGLTGTETIPDTTGHPVRVAPKAQWQSDLQPDPGHHFPDVDLQLYDGAADHSGKPSIDGFIKNKKTWHIRRRSFITSLPKNYRFLLN